MPVQAWWPASWWTRKILFAKNILSDQRAWLFAFGFFPYDGKSVSIISWMLLVRVNNDPVLKTVNLLLLYQAIVFYALNTGRKLILKEARCRAWKRFAGFMEVNRNRYTGYRNPLLCVIHFTPPTRLEMTGNKLKNLFCYQYARLERWPHLWTCCRRTGVSLWYDVTLCSPWKTWCSWSVQPIVAIAKRTRCRNIFMAREV